MNEATERAIQPRLGDGVPVVWVTLPDGTKQPTGGTKLFVRTDPPANDQLTYSAGEPGDFLGYFVARLSVPRWMSSHFSDAVDANEDLDKYSQDWMENIYYVQTSEDTMTEAEFQAINTLVAASPVMSHNFSTGCAQVTPQATLQPLNVDAKGALLVVGALAEPYYALASGHLNGDITKITEWAVAKAENRSKFESSAIHNHVLKLVIAARDALEVTPEIVGKREQLMDHIDELPDGFQA